MLNATGGHTGMAASALYQVDNHSPSHQLSPYTPIEYDYYDRFLM
jgi:hypothetical protein